MNDREEEPTGVEPPAETGELKDEGFVAEPIAKPESRSRQILRVAVRWLIILLIIFGAGAFVAYWFLYRPASAEVTTTNAQLAQANQQIADLQSQVNQLKPLGAENQRLQKELNTAQQHIQVLTALAEANAARATLADQNLTQAKAHLDNLSQNLNALQTTVPASEKDKITAMQSRLTLVTGEMDQNAFAAKSDLDVLANSLTELEKTLFGGT